MALLKRETIEKLFTYDWLDLKFVDFETDPILVAQDFDGYEYLCRCEVFQRGLKYGIFKPKP